MLNKYYGRPSDQSVLPPTAMMGGRGGDIYDQTSYIQPPVMVNQSHAQLKQQLKEREQAIMGQKSKGGIQCYDQSSGTTLDDAYRDIGTFSL